VPVPPETGWRIRYEILPPGTHGYGGAAVWEIGSVEFMRGYTATGEPDWIKVLASLAMVEMYVAYYDGYEVWDVAGLSTFVAASADALPRAGVIGSTLPADGVVVAEVVDDHARWMSVDNRVRRGEALELWATLAAANYRYLMRYSFHDDGTIRVRVGATGQNLHSVPVGDDAGVHVHLAAWRMEFDLGGAGTTAVHVVERIADPASAGARLDHRPFNKGLEGGETWNPERFTTLMVESTLVDDRHVPAHRIGYKMVHPRTGSARTHRPYTQRDVWATLVTGPEGSPDRLRFIDLPSYVDDPRPLDGQPVAIWTTSAMHHVPRTEDFGPVGYDTYGGLALTMWAGFDLMPHNLWDKTPLYRSGFESSLRRPSGPATPR
jgi:hypothetical protein